MALERQRMVAGLREAASLDLRWFGGWPPGDRKTAPAQACAVSASHAGLVAAHAEEKTKVSRTASADLPRRAERVPQKLSVRRLAAGEQFKGPKGTALRDLADEVAACKRCPLYKTRTQTVFGVGRVEDGCLMLVGEAPGHDEDMQGEPFVGAAGQLLDRLLEMAQSSRAGVYIGNVLKCRPPGNRQPQPLEVAMCLPFLRKQIELIRPAVLCALGRHAVRALTGREDAMNKLRGTVQEFEGRPVVPTYHPAYLLRNPADTECVVQDLARSWTMATERSFT